MRSNNALVEKSETELQRSYHDVLRRRMVELRTFANRCAEGQLAAQEIEDIHLRVRSLVGSGATYGYPDVSAAADPLDQALASPSTIGLRALAGLTENLAATCEQALQTEPRKNSKIPIQPAPRNQNKQRPVLLTVDDDPAIQDLIKTMYRDNAQTVAAYNGAEALDAVRRHCPDLILLDNYMPGMEGLELLEGLGEEKNSAGVPVIMLTADSRPREIMRATTAGVADYVIKPFEPLALAEKIQMFLTRSRMTVLIAHSNPTMRNLIANKLRRSGLNVVETNEGKNVLETAATHMPELILLDQSMMGTDDAATLHALRKDKRTRHIPLLYLASDGVGENILENIDTGATDHAAMPFIPEKIASRIMEALGLEAQGM